MPTGRARRMSGKGRQHRSTTVVGDFALRLLLADSCLSLVGPVKSATLSRRSRYYSARDGRAVPDVTRAKPCVARSARSSNADSQSVFENEA